MVVIMHERAEERVQCIGPKRTKSHIVRWRRVTKNLESDEKENGANGTNEEGSARRNEIDK
jgi:hypothetical protein